MAKFIRMSPRKVRLVTNLIKGMTVDVARTQLHFLPKAAVLPVLKLLNSAVANATNNFKLEESNLMVKSATTDGGPTLKRWRARAMGRAAPIRKRTSHITIILTEIIPSAPKTVPKKEEPKVAAPVTTEAKADAKLKAPRVKKIATKKEVKTI